MIGGRDIILGAGDPMVAMELALRAVRRLWPSAYIEDAVTGEPLDFHGYVSLFGRHEVLAFRDKAAADLWSKVGAGDATNGTLIHLLTTTPNELTIVVDDEPTEEMQRYVRVLARQLAQELFVSRTNRKRQVAA
jgi:hypothetical protein